VIGFDLPLLPPFDKQSVAVLWIWIGCLWRARGRIHAARPLRGIDGFFVLVLVANVGTVLTNSDDQITGPVVRQGLTMHDAFAGCVKDALGDAVTALFAGVGGLG